MVVVVVVVVGVSVVVVVGVVVVHRIVVGEMVVIAVVVVVGGIVVLICKVVVGIFGIIFRFDVVVSTISSLPSITIEGSLITSSKSAFTTVATPKALLSLLQVNSTTRNRNLLSLL